jgi:hypothetical protein
VPQISGRLEASVTVLPFLRNERVGQFHSFEHLKQALLASSCLVPLAGSPVWVDGLGYCIDGGLSDLQLLKGMSVGGTFSKIHVKGSPEALRSTITVCPFYSSRADIKPSRYLPPWWAFIPPSVAELDAVYRLGCALHPRPVSHPRHTLAPPSRAHSALAPLPRLTLCGAPTFGQVQGYQGLVARASARTHACGVGDVDGGHGALRRGGAARGGPLARVAGRVRCAPHARVLLHVHAVLQRPHAGYAQPVHQATGTCFVPLLCTLL